MKHRDSTVLGLVIGHEKFSVDISISGCIICRLVDFVSPLFGKPLNVENEFARVTFFLGFLSLFEVIPGSLFGPGLALFYLTIRD